MKSLTRWYTDSAVKSDGRAVEKWIGYNLLCQGAPRRAGNGISDVILSVVSLGKPSITGVLNNPGAIAITLTPDVQTHAQHAGTLRL